MKRTFATIAVFLVLLLIPFVVWAQTNVTLWDFLSGGDGVRWKAIINEFNTSQSDINIQGTTLTRRSLLYKGAHRCGGG